MADIALSVAFEILERQLTQFREAISGIPDDDLNTWKPAAESSGGGDMNTFGALAVHITGAGTWRLCQQVYGDAVERDCDAEFRATATAAEIDRMFGNWLAGFRERMDRDAQPNLSGLPLTPRDDHPDWNRMHWLLSMIDHTALHVGHVQVQRQLWETEKGASG